MQKLFGKHIEYRTHTCTRLLLTPATRERKRWSQECAGVTVYFEKTEKGTVPTFNSGNSCWQNW